VDESFQIRFSGNQMNMQFACHKLLAAVPPGRVVGAKTSKNLNYII
jgi:hypothetical protein